MDSSGIFTYDATLPTARDRMRHTLGDTDPLTPLRYDETYDALLSFYGDEATATAKLARSLATQFGRNPTSVSVPGGPSVSFGDRVRTWLDTATTIEKATVGFTSAPSPDAGGTMLDRGEMTPSNGVSEYRRGWDDIPWNGW